MSFLTFHSFTDEEVALDFAEKLQENDIRFRIEKTPPLLDSVIVGASSIPGIVIKLRQEDFNRAHAVLEEYYDKQVIDVSSDYYLFEFSNEELLDILRNPDTWGYFDQRLAIRILADRGEKVNSEMLHQFRASRKQVLSKPEKAGFWLIAVSYFVILAGIFFIINVVASGEFVNVFFPFSLFFAIFLGRHISTDKRVLPDGEVVYGYTESDRKHARIISWSSIIVMILSIVIICTMSF